MLKLFKVFTIIFFCLSQATTQFVFADDKPKEIEKTKKAIVTVESRVSMSAYMYTGNWNGTGFIVDKARGLVMTNAHVVGRAAVGSYFITFHNGKQAEAKSVYYDPYADYAILRVMPNELPEDIEAIKFANDAPKLGDKVFMFGNTESRGFSFHTGYLSNLYDVSGDMPQGTYVVNMNSTGGASGSPLINSNNEAIGILYGGGKTFALGLKASYLRYALAAISRDDIPQRRHIGVLMDLYSLDKAVKHRSFPKEKIVDYIKNFPDSRNKVLIARSVLRGSSAEGIIEPGDIIWQVNGLQVAADLALVDDLLNKSKDEVSITIFRNGKRLEKKVKTYDVNETKLARIFDFAGALFFQADDFVSSFSGIPIGSVVTVNVQTGSSFSSIPEMFMDNYKNIYRIVIQELNHQKITSLDDFIKVAKSAIMEKHVSVVYKNFQPYRPYYNSMEIFKSGHEKLVYDITFDTIDTKPRIIRFDLKKHEWVSEEI